MTTELTVLRSSKWWKWWPPLVAGFCGPLLGTLLTRWLPFHFAVGLAFFGMWFFVGLVFARRSPPKWGLSGWLAAALVGAAGSLCGVVLSFVFPWR